MQTGPDCRIYMHTGYCLPYMHIIMEPDKKGKDCDVRQHVLKFETPVCNIPYFPNFRPDTPYPYCNPEIVVVTGTSDFNPIVTTEKQISIHPNPSSGIFTIYAPDPIQSVSVYDLHGRRWMQQSGDLSDVLEINGTSLFSGMYIIKVVCGNNKIYTSRILKID
ncbi:MAG: T9SS type A sorting domain-containing protein [Saprospiraceae bacterium]|nr:T9SS type A sorting domain-containing protein [Saprospiraceae bacterium]